MKIKITQKGYETFTGLMGVTFFENAVSVGDVSAKEAFALSALLTVVDAETGEDIGAIAQERAVWDCANVLQPEKLKSLAELQGDNQGGDGEEGDQGTQGGNGGGEPKPTYTREDLEAVADKDGIAGLRKIGDPIGAKGTSIAKLIDEILQAQQGE